MSGRAFSPLRGPERPGVLTVVGLVLLPVVIGFILGWSLAAPQSSLSRVTAAVVNEDTPVTVDDQLIPLGREFAADLIGGEAGTGAPDDPGPDATATPDPAQGFTWILTNADDARAGLASGAYVAVVTIPSDFSADATSISGPGADAVQATIRIETTPTTAFLDPALTDILTRGAVSTLNAELTARYLTQVYDGFNQINASIAQAADGASELASGASSLSSGAEELAAGADRLSAGIDEVDAGAESLASGLDRLDASVQSLPPDARRLASGSAQVARALDAGALALTTATREFAAIVDEICALPGPLCARAQSALSRVESADAAVATLAVGADEVAAGNAALAVALDALVQALDASAAGASQLAAGADESAAGAASVAEGAGGVAGGAASVDEGAAQLADGLGEAVQQIPTYSTADISVLSATVAVPVTTEVDLPPDGSQSVPLFTVIALWLATIVTALAIAAVPGRRLLTSASTVRLTARALAMPLAIGAAQGALTAAVLAVFLTSEPWRLLAFTGMAVVVGAVFAAVNVGLAALFGGPGRAVAAIAGVIALVVGVSSTVPAAVRTVDAVLPTGSARDVLLAVQGFGGFAPVVALVVWGVIGVALVYAGVARRRSGAGALG